MQVQELHSPLLEHSYGFQIYYDKYEDIEASTKFSCWENMCENAQVLGKSL